MRYRHLARTKARRVFWGIVDGGLTSSKIVGLHPVTLHPARRDTSSFTETLAGKGQGRRSLGASGKPKKLSDSQLMAFLAGWNDPSQPSGDDPRLTIRQVAHSAATEASEYSDQARK